VFGLEAEGDVDVEELVRAQGQLALDSLLEGAAAAADEANKRGGADATDPNLPIPTARLTVDAAATFRLWAPAAATAGPASGGHERSLLTATVRLRGEASADVGSGAWDAALQLAGLEVLDLATPMPTFPALFTTHAPSSLTSGGAAHGAGGASLGAVAALGGAREAVVWDETPNDDGGGWADALVMGAMAVGPVLSMPIEEATDVAVGVRCHPKKGLAVKVAAAAPYSVKLLSEPCMHLALLAFSHVRSANVPCLLRLRTNPLPTALRVGALEELSRGDQRPFAGRRG
jgi:hypothetical protein